MKKKYEQDLRNMLELGIIILFFVETDVFMFFIYWTVLSMIAFPFFTMGASFMLSSIVMFILSVIFHHVFKNHKNFLDILVNFTGSAILASLIMFIVGLF